MEQRGRISGGAILGAPAQYYLPDAVKPADKPVLFLRAEMLQTTALAMHEQASRIEHAINRAVGSTPAEASACEARGAPDTLDMKLLEAQDSLAAAVNRLRTCADRLDAAV